MSLIARRAIGTLLLMPLFAPAAVAAPRPAEKSTKGEAKTDPVKTEGAKEGFVAVWEGAAQGPYPVGNPSAQPDLRWAFPNPSAGARDQTFRLIVKPDLWGREARLRFTNVFGTRPVTFDGAFVGVQESGAAVLHGTNRPVSFAGAREVTVAPGQSVLSDPVTLPVAATDPLLAGRKLAVSFHIGGPSGPMTWHAKAQTTSYLTAPGAGVRGEAESEAAFAFTTTSWFFLDLVEMSAPAGTGAVVCLGDSVTDGTATTLNGDDRWSDVFSRRLKEAGNHSAVVNAGIGGNRVVGPTDYTQAEPFAGGPSALSRLDRDVASLSGVTHVIWLEGINDLGKSGGALKAEPVIAGLREGAARLRTALPGVVLIGATLTSALGSTNPSHGSSEEDAERRKVNDFIRKGGVFDHVADFDSATIDPLTGALRSEFVPDSTTGGPGDKIHPNHAGHAAMAETIDLDWFTPRHH